MVFPENTASPFESGKTSQLNHGVTSNSTSPETLPGIQSDSPPSHVAFVDKGIADIETLIQGISASKVVLIDSASNGISQITNTLSQYDDLASVQIFSHGSAASLDLGNAQLSSATLSEYTDELTQWGAAIAPDGDLLFYACDLTGTTEGHQFVKNISDLTQTDVAASSDLTGEGGDWELETSVGSIEADSVLSASAQADFTGTLNVLANGGFESGLNDWFGFSGQESTVNGAFNGSKALRLNTDGSGTAQTISATANETYTLEGYAKSSSNGYSAMGLTFFDANYNTLSYTPSDTISGADWKNYQVEVTAPTGTAFAQVWTYKSGNNGAVEIDALSLTTGKTPPAPDTTRPTANINAAGITNAGGNNYEFSVAYNDNTAIDVSTLDNNDVVVTGPNGFTQSATFIGVNNNSDGAARTAQYRINAPNGSWSDSANGTYTVALQANQVTDTSNNALLATTDSFEVNIETAPPTGGGTELLTNGGFESGLTDWFGFSGQEQISTSQTFNGSGSLQLSASDSGTGTILDATPGETYKLSGYAKTSSNGYSAFGLNFFDSNYGVVGRVDSGDINAQNWQQFQMEEEAPAGTAFVQVWTYKSGSNGSTFIDALSLKTGDTAPPADTTAPTASISAANVTTDGTSQYEFSVTYGDDTAVDVSSLDNNDIQVTGPNGFSQAATFVSASNNSAGSPRTATYRLTPPGNSWSPDDNGTYTVQLRANQVSDTSGNTAAATNATFTVNIDTPPGDTPVITSNGGGATATLSVKENTPLATDVNATGTGLTYAIAGGTDANDFTINATTGVLSFATTPDYENPLDANGDNSYAVNVSATNATGQSDTQALVVNVTNEVSVFLLGGQSNMVGQASNSNLPTNLQSPYPAVQIWQEDIQDFSNLRPGFAGASGNWPEFGPELTFGRGIDGVAPEEVYLIKHATGSTTLATDWNPNGANNGEYDIFTNRVTAALADLTSDNVGYTIEGMLWMQGESDTGSGASAYEANLTAFIADMRDRYGSGLRFVIGKLNPTFTGTVTDAQEAVAAADARNYIVDTDNFELLSDQVHYNASGLVDLGFAFADVIKDTF